MYVCVYGVCVKLNRMHIRRANIFEIAIHIQYVTNLLLSSNGISSMLIRLAYKI